MWRIRYDSNRPNVSKKLSGNYTTDLDARKALVNWLKQTHKAPLRPKFKYKPNGRPTKAKVKSVSSAPGWKPKRCWSDEHIQKMKDEYVQWQKQSKSGS